MTVFLAPNNNKDTDNERMIYIVIFCVVLIISIIATFIIYYCVRYKKKYFFDAAGRKFIESTGELSNLINKLMEVIQFDNKEELEQEVISKNNIKIF
jgi:hypothetical protein